MTGMGRWDRIRMPSECADGIPAGTQAGPVITYRLSDEELATYRGEGSRMPTGYKLDRAEIYRRFAAGEGRTYQELTAMSQELGCHPSALLYHRKRWEASQAAANEAASAAAETPGPAGPAAAPDAAPEQSEAEQPAAPAPEPDVPAQPADRPRRPEVGGIYEGIVEWVETGYVLVNLPAFYEMGSRRAIRGWVIRKEIADKPVDDAHDVLHEGDLVNIRVLRIRPTVNGKRQYDFSIRQAPPHPEQPASLGGPGGAAAVEAEQIQTPTLEPAPMPIDNTQEVAIVANQTVNLCDTCIKRDICPLAEFYGDPTELPDESRIGRLALVQIEYGPRPVTRCSAYREEQGAAS